MKQTVLNNIEYIKGFLVKLFCKKSNSAMQKIEPLIEYLNTLPRHTECELMALIEELKKLPKQREEQLRVRIKELQYLPKITRKELSGFVKHLSYLPEQTKQEFTDLIEHIQYLTKRMKENCDAIGERLGRLPLQNAKLSDTLIDDINSLNLASPIKEEFINYVQSIVHTEQQKLIANIGHLEQKTQAQLITLTDLIKKHVPNSMMVVLFGSYARGRAVIYDEYYVNGVRNTYQSDFDIMVVVPSSLSCSQTSNIEERLNDATTEEYDKIFADKLHTPPQFIVETESTLIKKLKRKQPFFTDIISDGIVLFNNGKVVLPEPKEFSFAEKKEFAEEGFEGYIDFADCRLFVARTSLEKGWYKGCAFDLHQACENYYHALGMVFDNYTPKLHKLNVFISRTKGYSRNLASIFPRNTEFENNTFKLLCQAYIKARYDRNYTVNKQELEYMTERIEILKTISHRLCKERIAYYDSKMKDESNIRS